MLQNRSIVIFDGVCNLCNGWVRYIIKRDPEGVFSFASMQSDIAKELIEKHRGSEFELETILLIKNGICYDRSDAVMEIVRELPRCSLLFWIIRITPKHIRDFFYKGIAKRRYRLFGKRDHCMMPTQEVRSRFLES
jgi:predicted DCC family thiol-disulfide oxidoreductase YuxK